MGQSATLYRISQADFKKITEEPHNVDIPNYANGYITFEQTFEGIKFLLSKEQDEATVSLVEQIFYPVTCIGQETEDFDLEDIPDDIDFGVEGIYYHEPVSVAEICSFLNGIGIERFNDLYNADELNDNNVYPSKVWSNDADPDNAFNSSNLAKDFVLLKQFIAAAKAEEDYVLCFVG